MTKHRLRHAAFLALLVGGLGVAPVAADRAEGEAAIAEAAARYGAPLGRLRSITECESHFEPSALGDSGHSHGLVQINDRPTGLLAHFHAQGYQSAYNATEAADYLARVSIGTWAREGVTLGRWSCS